MEIVNPLAQAYAEQVSSAEDPTQLAISRKASIHPHGQMSSGHLQGKLLELISHLMQPARILEIGTFMGYSAICLAKGLQQGGKLHSIELRAEDVAVAQGHINQAHLEDRIILHQGNALDIIAELAETWDLVFIDADKTGYEAYYKLVLPRLRPGGLIIADNVLFHGEVLENEIRGKNAKAIHAFNEMVKKDSSVEKVLLTVRDGLLLIRKNK